MKLYNNIIQKKIKNHVFRYQVDDGQLIGFLNFVSQENNHNSTLATVFSSNIDTSRKSEEARYHKEVYCNTWYLNADEVFLVYIRFLDI